MNVSPMSASTSTWPAVMLAKSRTASAKGLASFPMISMGVMITSRSGLRIAPPTPPGSPAGMKKMVFM